MSARLSDQLRAYFDDVDRQQGAVDIDALRRGVEEPVITIELSPEDAAPPSSPTRGWRWPVLAAAAVVLVVIATLVVSGDDDGEVGPAVPPSTTSSTTEVITLPTGVARPLDPPIACEVERCPSLAVSPEGTLVAFDPAAKTITWYDAEPHVLPVTTDIDAEQARLVAVGNYLIYLLVGSPDTDSWELVAIDPGGEVLDRAPASSPDIEQSDGGLVERSCWNGCANDVRVVMPWYDDDELPRGTHPDLSWTPEAVVVRLGDRRWEVAWPHTLSTRSRAARRWDGGVTLSLVAESHDAESELMELLPDGTTQRFVVGDLPVHALLTDGSAIVWHDGQLLRLAPPRPAEPPPEWSPELRASPVEFPIACVRSPSPSCERIVVSPDGALVTYDPATATLTWYDDEPRTVPITAKFWGYVSSAELLAIGPHDIAYFKISYPYRVAAVGPTGAVIAQADVTVEDVLETAAGLLKYSCTPFKNRCIVGSRFTGAVWPSPFAPLMVPWIDLDGNQITDSRVYPTARDTDAGVEVRLGERTWLLTEERLSGYGTPTLLPRSDGGAVAVLDETFDSPGQPVKLVELSPDGTIQRFVVPSALAVLPDGSVITVDRDLRLTRLTPPA